MDFDERIINKSRRCIYKNAEYGLTYPMENKNQECCILYNQLERPSSKNRRRRL